MTSTLIFPSTRRSPVVNVPFSGPKPIWRCGCGYWLPRNPKAHGEGPICPYCSTPIHQDRTVARPVHMHAAMRVAPNKED